MKNIYFVSIIKLTVIFKYINIFIIYFMIETSDKFPLVYHIPR
nr:MAG TPA: hypothetical protein [Caudoviricetes sp.]